MAEEATDDETTGAAGDRPLAGAALKSALEKERKERKELEKTVKSLQAQVEAAAEAREAAKREAEDASKSALEKLSDQVKNLTAERDQERTARESAEQDRTRVEHIRRHAGDFADADDVIDLLRGRGELDSIVDDDAAKRVLAELKRDKPHLLKREDNLSDLQQVLKDGKLQTDRKPSENGIFTPADARSVVPFETLNQMDASQLKELKGRDPGLYERSMDALSGYGPDGMKVVVQ